MGYNFSGIITNTTDDRIVTTASKQWKFIKSKSIHKPFKGLALINYVTEIYDKTESEYEEDDDKREEQKYQLEREIQDFSKSFPDAVFLFIIVDCWGGKCGYFGTSYQNGNILDTIDPASDESELYTHNNNLRILLQHFDCNLNDVAYFEPFTRGYFDR